MLDYFRNDTNLNSFKDLSDKLNAFLKESKKGNILEDELPFRWSSGGVLPITNYRHKKWVVLFFRDIPPIGWNIVNGASENVEEQKSINRLVFREFSDRDKPVFMTPLEKRQSVCYSKTIL